MRGTSSFFLYFYVSKEWLMKKTIKFLALCSIMLLLINTVYSQNEKFSIGVKVLPGISKETELISNDYSLNIGVSLFAVKNFTKTVGVESGLSYRNYGFQDEITFTNQYGQIIGSGNVRWSYNYISVPIILRVNLKSFYFLGGANLNILTSAFIIPPEGIMVSGEEWKKTEIENTQGFVIEPTIGLGYQFNIKNKFGLNLEAFASRTINGIYDSGDGQILNFGLGIGFCYFISPRATE